MIYRIFILTLFLAHHSITRRIMILAKRRLSAVLRDRVGKLLLLSIVVVDVGTTSVSLGRV